MAPAPKNTNRGDQPPAYGETSSPPQPPQPAYGRDGGYYGYDQNQPNYYQQGIQSPQGQQAYYQPGPQMSYYNQQQSPFPGQGQYYGGGQYPGQGQYPQGQNTYVQYPQGQYPQGQYYQGNQRPGYVSSRPPNNGSTGFLEGLAIGTACCCCLDCLLC
ncbi:uncharacterized protein TrAtP1_001561 [Trichoderma atroviride]|uniref:Cysteine-rich transmembrane CYSTM domain-containing protein n=1 Tax=Hypocrea atroviridis (strain ATCC 20476 / IMI 206040) TaxID=452589 RepID=G9P0Y2_HYPAI|nr:uncharacterized protein TRIATDRAFT_301131 [Trichoderma atroviride IMI 206040]EHK43229.1 hypothetical protein TRIATDRAFT_301131 [Trichoderma atroviride IMI 206040]UKZ60278.1 hypothetical protein TrAtP1_001561 [Trichoderma atroviride]